MKKSHRKSRAVFLFLLLWCQINAGNFCRSYKCKCMVAFPQPLSLSVIPGISMKQHIILLVARPGFHRDHLKHPFKYNFIHEKRQFIITIANLELISKEMFWIGISIAIYSFESLNSLLDLKCAHFVELWERILFDNQNFPTHNYQLYQRDNFIDSQLQPRWGHLNTYCFKIGKSLEALLRCAVNCFQYIIASLTLCNQKLDTYF